MPKIVITDIPPWDGEYPFDDFSFTNRELFEIRNLSRLRASELVEALQANDSAAFVGVAVVVMARNGKVIDPDDLWDAKAGQIVLDLRKDGNDADPPTTPPSGSETESTGAGGGDGSENGGE